MTKENFYFTTPIFYPNDNLHLGHTYSTIAVDTLKKFKEFQGHDVFFTTGTDEHGEKLEEAAHERGFQNPLDFIDPIVEDSKKLWELLEIDYDSFIRSTSDQHEKNVQEIFTQLYDKGDIYKGSYEGYYCTPCESFWTEPQLTEEGNCPDCNRPVELKSEETYFFKLSEYEDKLKDLYADHPEFLKPDSRRHEMLNNFLDKGLDDLSVTRSSFDWGVPVPFDEDHVVYVWIDALSCYLTAVGYGHDEELFDKFWSDNVVHFVGKEIVRFHTIIWPALLMALDIPVPKQVFGHGWILFDNEKMSKSIGNTYYPEPIIEAYGVDALKYHLLREFTFGHDGNFTRESFLTRVNSDLANDLGNLLSRTVSMIDQYNDSVIEAGAINGEYDEDLKNIATAAMDKVEAEMEEYQFSRALEEIWKVVRRTNRYVDETEPWIVSKEEGTRIDEILYNLAESLRIISVMLTPFLPHTAKEIRAQLGLKGEAKIEDAKVWGLIEPGTKVQKGEIIFPRLDVKEEAEKMVERNNTLVEERMASNTKVDEHVKLEITIDDFAKLELRVAKITKCEDHPNADRLYVLEIDLGYTTKTIVSGLKGHYTIDELVDRKVIVVNNLAPHNFRGVESNGMILAAQAGEKLTLATVAEDIEVGAIVG